MYNVIINDKSEYEVIDAMLKKLYGIPTIPHNSANASQTLTNVLSHIAEYKYFEGVSNRIP
jgi:hypothetical protein